MNGVFVIIIFGTHLIPDRVYKVNVVEEEECAGDRLGVLVLPFLMV